MENRKRDEMPFAERLEQLISVDRIHLNPQINRDTVVALLGTNRTYLLKYLQQVYGLTFPGYIAWLRVNTAVEILTNTDEAIDIQIVAETVGFSCYSSFYRAFIRHYGMKPSDYVGLLNNK